GSARGAPLRTNGRGNTASAWPRRSRQAGSRGERRPARIATCATGARYTSPIIWQAEWKASAARIGGLMEAGKLLAESEQGDEFKLPTASDLVPEARDVYKTMHQLWDKFGPHLPKAAADALMRYREEICDFFNRKNAVGAIALLRVIRAA